MQSEVWSVKMCSVQIHFREFRITVITQWWRKFFFVFLFFFPFCSLSSMSASVVQGGVGVFSFYASIPFLYLVHEASVAEWLERAVAVQEISGSSPGQLGHKNLCGIRNLLTTSVSAWLSKDSGSIHFIHTIISQDNTTLLTNALNFRTGSRSVPTRRRSLISSHMTYSGVCCMSEKHFFSY